MLKKLKKDCHKDLIDVLSDLLNLRISFANLTTFFFSFWHGLTAVLSAHVSCPGMCPALVILLLLPAHVVTALPEYRTLFCFFSYNLWSKTTFI